MRNRLQDPSGVGAQTPKLFELNSPARLAGGSNSEFKDCGFGGFAIASPT